MPDHQNEYGAVTIVPLRTAGELRVSVGEETERFDAEKAEAVADLLRDVPDPLLGIDNPGDVATGLREHARRLSE